MKTIFCKGSSGYTPSGFMAGLGLLRLFSFINNDVKMGWCSNVERTYPFYSFQTTKDIPEVGKKIVKLIVESSKISNLKQKVVEKALSPKEDSESEYLGFGIAHIGDRIGVNPAIYRKQGEIAIEKWLLSNSSPGSKKGIEILTVHTQAALGCDLIKDNNGQVQYSPFSFSNGSGGQYLLKDFRACASKCTEKALEAYFAGDREGTQIVEKGVTSLNWDPSEQIGYSVRWDDPGDPKNKAAVNVVENALAYFGLSFLTATPGRKLNAVGWHSIKNQRGFYWPLWDSDIPEKVVKTLLCLPPDEMTAEKGIFEIRKSRVINPDGKRNYFAPSIKL